MSNFSYQPKMKKYDIIHTPEQLKGLAEKMASLEEWACFDSETEVLTENGWMRLDKFVELTNLPKVLSYMDGILQFKPVTKVIKKKHCGEMVRFQNKSLDMFMTPDHKVITYKNGKKVVTLAKDLKLSEHHKIKVAGERNLGIKSLSNIDRLFIAISADGHYIVKEDVFTFSFNKKRKIDRLMYLLDSLELPYTSGTYERKGKLLPEVHFRVRLPKYLNFTKGLHNIINLKDVSTNYAREFIEEVSLWDGSVASNCPTSKNYNTSNKEEVDFYSAMCVLANSFSQKTVVSNKSGKHSVENGYSEVYKAGCNLNKNEVGLTGSLESIPFDGEVYCIQVPDTQCFFARRGCGTPFLTHNCDTETNTLRVNGENKEFMIVGISISWGEYNNYYIPINHVRDEDYFNNANLDVVVYFLKPIFENPNIRLIGNNLKYDYHVFKRIGIDIKTKDIFDNMIASWLCDENTPNGLKENSAERLGIDQTHFKKVTDTVPKEVRKEYGLKGNSRVPFQLVLIEDGAPYALADAFYSWELYLGFENELEDEGMLKIYNKLYKPFIDCMFTVEENGVTVDLEKLEKMRVDIAKDCEDLKYKMFEIAGIEFNANSGQQKAELMFGYVKQDTYNEKTGKTTKANINQHIIDASFGFKPISYTKGGMPQTNNDVFWKYSHEEYPDTPKNRRKREGVEFCKLMVEYSKLEKLRSAFVEGMVEQMYDDGKIHCNFNINGATSGRLSASNPNLQQLPKADDEAKYQIRDLFIGSIDEVTGERNVILAHDFSNLEMKLLTHFSLDHNLLDMFNNNEDSHGSTAVNMFELDCNPSEVKKLYPHLRQASKTINFMLMFGGSAKTLYEALRDDHDSPIDLSDELYLKQYKCKNGIQVAQIYIDKYFSSYSGVAQFIKDQKRFAHKNGYVNTILGRKRRLPMIHSSNYGDVSYAERLSVNGAIQGSASDVTMSAQNLIHNNTRLKEMRVKMIMQVHDEVVFECPKMYAEEACLIIKDHMENMFGDRKLNLPITVEYDMGASYQEAK